MQTATELCFLKKNRFSSNKQWCCSQAATYIVDVQSHMNVRLGNLRIKVIYTTDIQAQIHLSLSRSLPPFLPSVFPEASRDFFTGTRLIILGLGAIPHLISLTPLVLQEKGYFYFMVQQIEAVGGATEDHCRQCSTQDRNSVLSAFIYNLLNNVFSC